MVKLLLENKTNPNQRDCFGVVPLSAAIREKNKEAVLLLLQHGAVIKTIDRRLCTLVGGHDRICIVCSYDEAFSILSKWSPFSKMELEDKINTMTLWYSISILGVLPNGFMPVELAGLIGQFVENSTTKEENIEAALQLFREVAES